MTVRLVFWAAALVLAAALPGHACFGARLRVGVPPEPRLALAAYALGYYLEEKAGVAPDFVEAPEPRRALEAGHVDLALAPAQAVPPAVVVRDAGEVPGHGPLRVWLRPDIGEDLRFALMDRVLGRAPGFLASPGFLRALESDAAPRKAARRAVLDAP